MSANGKHVKPIYIVDSDPVARNALSTAFELEEFTVEVFESADDFLFTLHKSEPACVMIDVHMPGRVGMDLLKVLNAENYPAPIFVTSGQADIPMAIDAVKLGACDLIEKPFEAGAVAARVCDALSTAKRRGAIESSKKTVIADPPCKHLPTPRELEVLRQITAGASNKEVGRQLGISPRTVEVHRARIMEKLKARNTADLVRIVLSGAVDVG